MKHFDWDEEKNRLLKEQRNISFEEIIMAIANNQLLDTVEHPNKEKYLNQKIFIGEVKNFVYIVPFVESSKSYFLKTIYPSRKATREFLKQRNRHGK